MSEQKYVFTSSQDCETQQLQFKQDVGSVQIGSQAQYF